MLSVLPRSDDPIDTLEMSRRISMLNNLDSTQLMKIFDRPGLEMVMRMKMPNILPHALDTILNLMFEAFVQGIVAAQNIINTGGETKQ